MVDFQQTISWGGLYIRTTKQKEVPDNFDLMIINHLQNGLIKEKVGVIHASHLQANTMTFAL